MRDYEYAAIAANGRAGARAAARMMAVRARGMLHDAERVLEAAQYHEAAAIVHTAGEAITNVITATYDGSAAQVFACKR